MLCNQSIQFIKSSIDTFIKAVAELIVEFLFIEFILKLIKWGVVGKIVVVPIEVALKFRLVKFVFFLVSVLINSQGAVVVAMLPLAYELGIAGPVLLGVLPSVYGYFFIPNYPSDIATVNFDRSGTTRIGKYLLNHSFMMPGLICVTVSTVVGYLIANVLFRGYFLGFVQ